MRKLKLTAPINLGAEVSISVTDIDEDGDYTGIAAKIKIDHVTFPVLWLCESGNMPKDVSEISDCEVGIFVQRVKMAERNGLCFNASNLPKLMEEFREIKSTCY